MPWAVFVYGLLFGYATMTRTYTVFMPFVAGFAYLLMKMPWKKVIVSIFLIALVMQLPNIPWIVRNYKAFGVPVFYTADAGYYIYSCFNDSADAKGTVGHVPRKGESGYSQELEDAFAAKNPGRLGQVSMRELKHYIVTHPQRSMVFGLCRVLYFMGWNRAGVWPTWFQFYEGSFDPARPISPETKHILEETAYAFYYFLFFCFFTSLGMIAAGWRRLSLSSRHGILVLGCCFMFWLAMHTIIFPDRKYRFPLEPLMMLLSVPFWEWLLFEFRWENLKGVFRGRQRQRAI